jgi:O-antigen/teichoic acid export membrane protein
MPRMKPDVVVLIVLVILVLRFVPGHGLWGWVLAVAGVVLVGVVMGIVGRRYPWIYGRRHSARGGTRK